MSSKNEEGRSQSCKPTECLQEESIVIITDASDLSVPSRKGKEKAKETLYLYRV